MGVYFYPKDGELELEDEVVAINNRKLYLRVLLAAGSLFEEYADFTDSPYVSGQPW